MLEILPSISAGSDKPRNGLISKVEGGNSSSGGVWALFLLPTLLALGWPSWACFKCCFILSGRENSFWQIEHGKTLRAAPSWYKKACLWKLYLFLKCLLICTRSHSTHLEIEAALRMIALPNLLHRDETEEIQRETFHFMNAMKKISMTFLRKEDQNAISVRLVAWLMLRFAFVAASITLFFCSRLVYVIVAGSKIIGCLTADLGNYLTGNY